MNKRISKTTMGLAAAGGVAAISLGAPLFAYASTGSSAPTPASSLSTNAGSSGDARGDGGMAPPGGETALTGATAASVTKAALAAVPGATVRRVTTEHAGAANAYEAHLTKTDGSRVTVLIGSAFNVISIESDHGKGHRGGGETALTGATAASVTKAALAAVPGATVRRVTTEHAGAANAYEAHLTKTDGSRVTVLVGSSFNVMSVETDPGPR